MGGESVGALVQGCSETRQHGSNRKQIKVPVCVCERERRGSFCWLSVLIPGAVEGTWLPHSA